MSNRSHFGTYTSREGLLAAGWFSSEPHQFSIDEHDKKICRTKLPATGLLERDGTIADPGAPVYAFW